MSTSPVLPVSPPGANEKDSNSPASTQSPAGSLRPDTDIPFVAPRTSVEQVLAGILAESLGVGRVGINDNFFNLGGHSLVAARVLARVRNIFNVEIPVGALFDAPTIAEFAQVIEQAVQAPAGSQTHRMAPLLRTHRRLNGS